MSKSIRVDRPENVSVLALLDVSSQEAAEFVKACDEHPAQEERKAKFDSLFNSSNKLPHYPADETRFAEKIPFVFLPGRSRRKDLVPFYDVPAEYAFGASVPRRPFDPVFQNDRRLEDKKNKARSALLIESIKIFRQTATPRQWRIVRRFFVNECLQEGIFPLKEIAEELQIPASTIIQQLRGRPRNGKWIGGLFPKAMEKIKSNQQLRNLFKDEQRLAKIFNEPSEE